MVTQASDDVHVWAQAGAFSEALDLSKAGASSEAGAFSKVLASARGLQFGNVR
jgi:hypothetical protein